ncbi:MAG: glycine C-acetyltransferase [Chloroflexota bacterium]
MDKTGFLERWTEELRQQGLHNHIRTIESAQGAWLVVDGKRCLNFCSNNYLGLANAPRLRRAATGAIEAFGAGPAAVRSIAGTTVLHKQLEARLAAFKEVEATVLFQSGWSANLAVIPAITREGDAIFSDELNHASIIDGSRLSAAKRYRFKHADAEDLRRQMTANPGFERALVITDGVFSMDGDIAPLAELAEVVAHQENVLLMVDDAHGEGVLGRGGRGAANHFGLGDAVDIEVGTLSKAFGVVGGYVAGRRPLIEYLKQRGRPFLFSSASTPADCGAALQAVEILGSSTELVDRLRANAASFQTAMRSLGFDLGRTQTPITPVLIGDEAMTREFSRRLFDDEAVFAMGITYPTVPQGKARIRVMLSAIHSDEDLEFGLRAFERVGRALGVI